MALTRMIETGRVKLEARLSIEGCLYEPCTAAGMERTTADGRLRVRGLSLDGFRLAVQAQLDTGVPAQTQGFTLRTVGGRGEAAAKLNTLWRKKPTVTTWLVTALTTSATTVEVASTDGFPISGVIHVGTEAISYTGVATAPTRFTGCTRGIWGTLAQAHPVTSGEHASNPRVTDLPYTLEGRRALLYLYSEQDDPQGDGTQRWIGTIKSEARFSESRWEVPVDSVLWQLAQKIGGDIESPIPIREIYYPWNVPFRIGLSLSTGASSADGPDETIWVNLTGKYTSQVDFCDVLTTTINAARATAGGDWSTYGSGTNLTAEAIDDYSWKLVLRTPSSGVRYVHANVDNTINVYDQVVMRFDALGIVWEDPATRQPATTMAINSVYEATFLSPVPRAFVGSRLAAGVTVPEDRAVAPDSRIYVGGTVALSTGLRVQLSDEESGDSAIPPRPVSAVDAGQRFLEVSLGSARALGPTTRLKLQRELATGSLADLLDTLIANSPGNANSGAGPLVRAADWAPYTDVIAEAIGGSPAATDRVWTIVKGKRFGDILAPELQLAGLALGVDSTGRLKIFALRHALATDGIALAINASMLVDRFVTLEQNADGQYSEVIYRYGYDATEDKYTSDITIRNVANSSPNRAAKALEVKPYSRRETWDESRPEISLEDVTPLAMRFLGVFGVPYDVLAGPVNFRCFDLEIGDSVTLTSRSVPDQNGTIGVTGVACLVTGVDWDLPDAKGVLTLQRSLGRSAGYAPALKVTSQSNVSGNIWDVTLTVPGTYSDRAAEDWWSAGDAIRIIEYDASSPMIVRGVVTSVQSAHVLRVTLDGAWTPSTLEWYLGNDVTTDAGRQATQAVFADMARATRRIQYASTTDSPDEIAP